MNKFTVALAGAALIVTAAIATSQTPEPDYRVDFPKGDARWSITLKESGQKPSSASSPNGNETPELKEIEIVKQGAIRRDICVWSDGVKSEHWWSIPANYVFFENRGDSEVRGIKASQKVNARYDETFFSWVGKNTYAGERTLQGNKYWYFETSYRNEAKEQSGILEAWVDPKTARPVAWSDGQRIAYFEFKPLDPGFKLVMPQKFAEAFARYSAYKTPPTRVKRR